MTANTKQVGGDHYKKDAIQPWDFVVSNGLGYLEGCIIKYVSRYKRKGGVEDLKKALHFLEKLIEVTNESSTMGSVAAPTDPKRTSDLQAQQITSRQLRDYNQCMSNRDVLGNPIQLYNDCTGAIAGGVRADVCSQQSRSNLSWMELEEAMKEWQYKLDTEKQLWQR